MVDKVKSRIEKGKKGIPKAMEDIVYHARGSIDTLFDFQGLSKSSVLELVNMVELKKAIEEAEESTEELKRLKKWSVIKMVLTNIVGVVTTYYFIDKVILGIEYLTSHKIISAYIIVSFVMTALCNVLDVGAIHNVYDKIWSLVKRRKKKSYFESKKGKEKRSLLLAFINSFGMKKEEIYLTTKEITERMNKKTKNKFTQEEVKAFMVSHSFKEGKDEKYCLNKDD